MKVKIPVGREGVLTMVEQARFNDRTPEAISQAAIALALLEVASAIDDLVNIVERISEKR